MEDEVESRGTKGRRGMRRRWWAVLAAAIVLAIAVWQVLEYALDVEQYRPRIEQEIAELTGLPVSIESLDLAWRPIPCLSALGVVVGEGDFQATAERIDVFPALHALLWRELEILDVAVRELVLVLPEDGDVAGQKAKQTWAHVEATLDEPGSSSPSFVREVSVRRITARDLAVRRGAAGDPSVTGSVIARDVTGDRIDLEVSAVVPSVLSALARGAVDVGEGEGVGLSFQADLVGEGEAPLRATVHGSGRFGGEEPDAVQLEASGDGLALTGSVELGEPSAVQIASLSVRGTTLAALLDLAEGAGVELSAGGDAALEGKGVEVTLPSGKAPRLASGTLSLRGVSAGRDGRTLAADVRADALLADGQLELEMLRAGPLTLHGRIAPVDAWSRFDVSLSGRLTLSDGWLRGLGASDGLRDVKGVLEVDELAGRFPAVEGEAPPVVRAHLSDGSLRVAADGFEDSVSAIQLSIGLREEQLRMEGSARSAKLGTVSTTATLVPSVPRAQGHFEIDAEKLNGFISDEGTRERTAPVLEAYGRSRVAFELAPVPKENGSYRLKLERDSSPSLSAALTLRTEREPMLGDVSLSAEFPTTAERGLLPPGARLSGSTGVELERSASTGALNVKVDLVDAAIATGRFVDKKVGEVLTVEIDREAEKGNFSWVPRRLTVRSARGSVSFAIEEGALVAPDLDVDLADWRFLLVDTASASGRIRGSYDGRIPTARLALSDVALRFSPEVGLDSVNGNVAIDSGKWSVRDLRLRGEQTDATLDAELADDRLQGRLIGKSLDVDFVRSLVGEIEAIGEEPDSESAPLSGSFLVQLDRIGVGNSTGRNFHAQVALDRGDVRVSRFGFETEEGAVTGAASVEAREGDVSWLALQLDAKDLGGPFLDDLLDEEDRGIRGTFDAKLRFEAPLHDDVKKTVAGASGAAVARGRNGTFGKLGFATKLVTVLRSTETLRLKLPTFRDEGLVFDDTWLEGTMKEGELTLTHFGLESTSYALKAEGVMDFRKEKSKVPIQVDAIKGLTGIVEYIPMASEALKLVNVRLVATGSPYDLKVGIASVQDQLIGVGMVGPKAVIDGVGDVLRLMQGKGLKANGGNRKFELPPLQPGEVAVPGVTEPEPAPQAAEADRPVAEEGDEVQADGPAPGVAPPSASSPAAPPADS